MRTSNVVVALVIVALLNSVYGHLCIYTPRQRGDFFNGEAAQHQCFRPKVPCGGQTFSGKIASIVTGNAPFQVFFQQNLNHYSIGNTGYLSVAISRNPEPTSQDDFLPLAYVTDYYPVRQWTQTNFSVTVNLPSNFGACDHCVLQVRYVPHKPTEPIFHQCSDIKVTAASNIAQQSVPVVNEPAPLKKLSNNVTMNNGDSLYGLFQQRDHVQFVQVDTASARTAVIARLENFVISDGLTISASTPLNKIRIQNAVATADLSGSRIFYLANADTKFATPDSFPDQLLIIDARDGSFRLLPIGNTVPLSNLFYVAAKNSLYTWSIDVKQGAWALLRIDPETGRIDNSPVVVRNPADVGPYVNYLWSTYDSVQNRLITLVRHEDEPLKLDQKLYIVDFKNNFNFTEVFLNSTLYYTFSDLHFDSANQQQLLTLSPGAAPALPVTTMKKWSMIRINLEQKTSPSNHPFQAGEQDFEYLINEPFNQYLGGGVFRGLNQKAQLMYKVVQSKDDFRILSASTSGPTYSLSPVNNDLEKIYNLIYLA